MESSANSFNLFQFIKDGGPFMVVVFALSILAAILVIERYIVLRMRYEIDGRRLFNEIKKFLASGDHRRALETCQQYPLVPLAQVLAAGLKHSDQSAEDIEMAMETETLFWVPKVNERLSYLPNLANTATLIGLLGTITGLIVAFSASSGASSIAGLTKEQALAHGISYAMYTTAAALAMAIPTVLAGMWLGAKANGIIDDIDHYASALKHLIHKKKSGKITALDIAAEQAPQKEQAELAKAVS